MTEVETFSLVVRVFALVFVCCTAALLAWWHMTGPAWALAAAVAAVALSIVVDLGRHTK